MQPERPSNSWVVGVGSSAGGLEALMTFVSHLPANSPASYIFAQHLPPHLSSMMVELLSRDSKLPIVAATDNNILIPGEILMIPPNYDGEIVRGRLVLTIADDLTRPKPSVDRLFISLAKNFGLHAAGIIFSGTGTDGTQGVVAIKAAGGVTFAQDLFTARFSGMPQAAQDSGQIDYVLSPREMILERPGIFGEISR
jgi:two-component system CheB/CheR fusion protein